MGGNLSKIPRIILIVIVFVSLIQVVKRLKERYLFSVFVKR
jgi:hypothetical protein